MSVAEYKGILRDVLARRPSGTRQRLATALGKNRSFISQITNIQYSVPIPARHVERIFEICHFSSTERKQFLAAYQKAHPRRLDQIQSESRVRAHTVYLPDLGSDEANHRLGVLVNDFASRLGDLFNNGTTGTNLPRRPKHEKTD